MEPSGIVVLQNLAPVKLALSSWRLRWRQTSWRFHKLAPDKLATYTLAPIRLPVLALSLRRLCKLALSKLPPRQAGACKLALPVGAYQVGAMQTPICTIVWNSFSFFSQDPTHSTNFYLIFLFFYRLQYRSKFIAVIIFTEPSGIIVLVEFGHSDWLPKHSLASAKLAFKLA